MNAKIFSRKLKKIIEDSDEFTTDTIDMKELKRDVKKQGFDDVILVAGEDSDEVFLMSILKI